MIDIILGVVISIAVAVGVYYYFRSLQLTPTEESQIVSSIVDGKTEINAGAILPESLNQKEGITFSYTCWLRVDDYSYKYGEQKVIFNKGAADLSSSCPGVFLDATTNTMLIKIDTFGSQEIIPVSNLPARKWFHFGLVVDQNSVDVYINGIAYTHRTITNLPKQNKGTVHVGINGGFVGKLANLMYYNYFISPEDMKARVGSPPTAEDTANFSTYWWTRSA